MTVDRELLLRYLRQRGELGEREVFLDGLTAAEAVAALRGAAAGWRTGGSGAAAGGSGAERPAATARADSVADRTASPQAGLARTGEEGGEVRRDGAAGGVSAADGLRVLAAEATGCTRCRLHEGRSTVVFGEGDPEAELVVVGEAPGFEEDRTGRPFVGPAGKLLDLMLLSIGFPRESVYICNVLKCRPPNNRDPQRDEVEACASYLHRQLDLIAPRALLAVGRFAVQTLTGSDVSIGRLRGRVHDYRGTPLVATYHPAFLLRSREWTRAAWQDLQLLREVLDNAAAPGDAAVRSRPSRP
ncbi:MAG TPA: uracil-DNA glycosylase [Longimicrobiales bacterium]